MKKSIAVVVFLFWMNLGYAQEYVAVLEFEGSGMSKIEARNVTERFSYTLQQTRKFKIIERQQLDLILTEQKTQLSGCVADECAVKVGELAGARYVIAGSVTKTFGLFGINVKLIDVESGEIITHILESDEPDVQIFLNQRVRNAALRLAAEGSQTTSNTERGNVIAVTGGEKGTVNFLLDKSGAAVFVDGAYTTQTSGNSVTLNLAEGDHDIKFTLAGHQDWRKRLNVLAGETLNYDVEFESGKGSGGTSINFGIVMVRSQPDGAMVYLDGVELGPTPAQNTKVSVGKHLVRVEKALYHPYVEEVNILPDGIEQVQADLKPNFGSLQITSVPTGAVVQINGQQKGKTPLELPELQSGDYTIQLTKELYHPTEEMFTIVDGSENDRNIALNPAFGKLAVNSEPVGSDVYLDGQFKGKAPLEIDELPSGTFRLKVSQELYESFESEITIEDGKTLTQTLILEPRFGTLTLTGSPAGAQIMINGQTVGKLPLQNFKTETGLSQIQISAPHYHAHEEFVQVEKNGFYPLTTDLVRHSGTVVAITDPPEAMITLDGERRGLSPQILKAVPTGEHTLVFKHPDFLEETRLFSLGLDERKEFNLKLMTYEGSIQQEIDRLSWYRNISLAGAGGLAVAAFVMKTLSSSAYDDYLVATDVDEIRDLYKRANALHTLSAVTAGVAILASAPAVYYQMDIGKMRIKLNP